MDLVLPWTGHRLDPLAFLSFAYNTLHPGDRRDLRPRRDRRHRLGRAGRRGPDQHPRRSSAPRATAAVVVPRAGCDRLLHGGRARGSGSRCSSPRRCARGRASPSTSCCFGCSPSAGGSPGWSARRGGLLAGAVAVGLAFVGVLDQTNPGRAPDHAATAARFASAAEVHRGPRGRRSARVPGLPAARRARSPSPAGTGEMKGYDQLLPYLASDDLQVQLGSHAGHRGRRLAARCGPRAGPTAWPTSSPRRASARSEVDTQGFDRRPTRARALTTALGGPVAQSEDGVYVAYALPAPSSGPTGKDAAVLHPVLVALDAYEIQHDGDLDGAVGRAGRRPPGGQPRGRHRAGDHLDDGPGSGRRRRGS